MGINVRWIGARVFGKGEVGNHQRKFESDLVSLLYIA